MKIYTLIELADIEVISVQTFTDRDVAIKEHARIAEENLLDIYDVAEFDFPIVPTLIAFAGDDAYSVELHETTISE